MARAARTAGVLRPGAERARGWLAPELILAGVVVGGLALLVVPLPPWVVDSAVAVNVAVSLVALLLALNVREALRLATFPTLLLLSAVLRLGIAVAATRLILLRADPGRVVAALGRAVTGGEVVVGVVILAVVTVVQLLVVARGAERVAEVGARFALDALPGQQLSIDAEARAGHIDAAEGTRRRRALQRSSQFYGAMDGAMKFVKGDAIATLVIFVVTFLGGLATGVGLRGQDLALAARTYAVLTVGLALVSQVPAILMATAAGVLATRVSPAAEGSGAGLAPELLAQLTADPRALGVATATLLVLAALPGVPTLPFAAAGLGVAALALRAARRRAADTPMPGTRATEERPNDAEAPALAALEVVVSLTLPPATRRTLREPRVLNDVRRALWSDTGLPAPTAQVRVRADGPGDWFAVRVHERPAFSGGFTDVTDSAGCAAELARAVDTALRRDGWRLLGIEETRGLLAALEVSHPALVREVLPRVVTLPVLCDLLRALAREGVSVRPLREICESLARVPAGVAADGAALLARVRRDLGPQLTSRYVDGNGVVDVFRLDPLVEEALLESLPPRGDGAPALEPGLRQDLLQALERQIPADGDLVLVTSARLRAAVRALVEPLRPGLTVLAFDELAPETTLRTRATISPG